MSRFHHLLSVGGTVYDSSSKVYGYIQGIGSSTAIGVTPDVDILCYVESNTAVNVPTITNILGVSNQTQIDGLTVSNRTSFRPRNFIPVPPFLLSHLHESISNSNGDVYDALVTSVKAIKDFDTEHENDIEYTKKAKAKCKDFLFASRKNKSNK